jgi:imidazole glycerol phosphate synthase glutamine amidotransferase subunit
MIAIIDYGAGNLRSVQNTLDEIGAGYEVLQGPERLEEAGKIILPGVGHFGQMMRALDDKGLREPIRERILAGIPFLGICLGLHGLFTDSEEDATVRGLGIFRGTVRRFPLDARVPHMGWNDLERCRDSKLLANLPEHPYVYFAHSYYVTYSELTTAACTYTTTYTAILESANVFGVQFHPEKSGPTGLRIVQNFLELEGPAC